MKVILTGILLTMLIIAAKLNTEDHIQVQTPSVKVNSQSGRVVPISPNRINNYYKTTF